MTFSNLPGAANFQRRANLDRALSELLYLEIKIGVGSIPELEALRTDI